MTHRLLQSIEMSGAVALQNVAVVKVMGFKTLYAFNYFKQKYPELFVKIDIIFQEMEDSAFEKVGPLLAHLDFDKIHKEAMEERYSAKSKARSFQEKYLHKTKTSPTFNEYEFDEDELFEDDIPVTSSVKRAAVGDGNDELKKRINDLMEVNRKLRQENIDLKKENESLKIKNKQIEKVKNFWKARVDELQKFIN